MLTQERIQELATSGPKVKTRAVINFLSSLGGVNEMGACMNLGQDTSSYGWNQATVDAIRKGIREHFNPSAAPKKRKPKPA
jgi:hypothetical protein